MENDAPLLRVIVPSEEEEVPRKGAGVLSSMTNIMNSVLGAGILALPFAFARAGTVGGTFLVCWSALLNVVTMHFLSVAARRISRESGKDATFSIIASKMLPAKLDFVVDLVIVVLMLGLATSYLMIFGNLMSDVMRNVLKHRQFWVLVGVCVTSPLAFAKSVDSLKFTSTLAMLFMTYVGCVVVAYSLSESLDACPDERDARCGGSVVPIKFNAGTLESLSLTTFAYTAQTQLVPIANELHDYTQPKMDSVVLASIALCCGLYVVVGIAGYHTFGDKVESDLLESYQGSSLPVLIARVAVSFVVAFSYPLMTQPCRTSLSQLTKQPPSRCTLFILILTSTLALVVKDLGTTLSVIGSTASTAVAYIIPSAAYLAVFPEEPFSPSSSRRYCRARLKRLGAKFVFAYGVLAAPVCLVATFMSSSSE